MPSLTARPVSVFARYPTAVDTFVNIVLTEAPAESRTGTVGFLSETRECVHLVLTATCGGCGDQHVTDNDGATFAEDRDHEIGPHSWFALSSCGWAEGHASTCRTRPESTT